MKNTKMKFSGVTVNVPLLLEGFELSQQLTYEQGIDLVLDIDSGFQDAGFTEELITKLVKSLKADYTDEEINDFIESMHK